VTDLSLSKLKPAEQRRARKRVGRGPGSGKGRYAGRGIKGQKSRAGSHKMRAGFEGGQMPLYMRVGKQRGATSKDAMPVGPFRTFTYSVNVRELNRFDDGAEVTVEVLAAAGVIRNTKRDVKILGMGELTKKLSVTAHRFSASAREKIERAGGTVTELKPASETKKRRRGSTKPKSPQGGGEAEAVDEQEPEAPAADEPEASADAEPEAEAGEES